MAGAAPHRNQRARERGLLGVFAAAAVLGLVAAGTVVAETGTLQTDITACIESATGHLFLAPTGRPCPDASLTWNQQGLAGPQGAQGEPGPAGAQGPTGSSLGDGGFKVVTKTFQSKEYTSGAYPGKWWSSTVPPTSLVCPSGWIALTSGYSVRSLYYVNALAQAVTTVNLPITTASGRPIGFKVGLEVEQYLAPSKVSHLTKHPWAAALYVVCSKLSAGS